MRKPRALRPGDRVAVVALASPFTREDLDAGMAELRRLGFEPAYDDRVFARAGYVSGPAAVRATALMDAWLDPDVSAIVAVRGGYGSVQVLPLIDSEALVRSPPKALIGYSDVTSVLTFLTRCGIVAFHGPMLAGKLARGPDGYDEASFRAVLMRASPAGEITSPSLEALVDGEAAGPLWGGTLSQLVASLGTPYAFDPPPGHVLFLDEVGERPYRIDRMMWQLRLSGLLARAAAIVFGELPGCDEPGGDPCARGVVAELVRDFPGPVLYGLASGHTRSPALTLPLGVKARVSGGARARVIIEEAAVTPA
jgi:muramoyltetrapeptide carboxypeptidase